MRAASFNRLLGATGAPNVRPADAQPAPELRRIRKVWRSDPSSDQIEFVAIRELGVLNGGHPDLIPIAREPQIRQMIGIASEAHVMQFNQRYCGLEVLITELGVGLFLEPTAC